MAAAKAVVFQLPLQLHCSCTAAARSSPRAPPLTLAPPPSRSNIKIQSVGQTPNIIEADIKAGDNGILHVIDGMLIPTKLPAGTSIPSGRRL